ncbi:STT3 domain-containing protein, partial [Methylopila musalis]
MTSLDAAALSRTPSRAGALGVRAAPLLIWLACLLWWAWRSYAAGPDLMSTDDAMRLVEARDLLAGQGWFDLVQTRLDPTSGGVLMHWSRLIDLPIAALLAAFGALFPAETALRLTLLLWPALTFLPALLAVAAIGRAIAGPAGGVLSALMLALSPGLTGRFSPGMIDHHGAQVALMRIMLACALNADRSRRAALGA